MSERGTDIAVQGWSGQGHLDQPPAVAAQAFRIELRAVRKPLLPDEHLPASSRTEDLVPFLFGLVRAEPVEVFGAVYLDDRDRPLGYTMPYRGRTGSVGPEARHLLLEAWGCRSSAMVVFHNHPLGRPSPSRADISWTRSLLALSAPLGVEVRDHLILADEPEYFSMAEAGTLPGIGRPPGAIWSWEQEVARLEVAEEALRNRRGRRRARPKYRDPETGETWAGRGTMANWLRRRLEQGHALEDFRIPEEEAHPAPRLD